MNTRIPLYEGDGYLHARPTPSLLQDGAAARTAKRAPVTPEQVHAIEAQARQMRANTIAAMLRSLADGLGRGAREALRGRAEAILERSTDVADLERRMRMIEQPSRIRVFG